jgi:hypothetical protein
MHPFILERPHDLNAPLVLSYDVERVLADIDADHGDCAIEFV